MLIQSFGGGGSEGSILLNENLIIATTIWDQDDLSRAGYTDYAEEMGTDPVQELIDTTIDETKGSPNPYARMTDITWVDTYEDLQSATDVCTTIERSDDGGAIEYYACDLQHVHHLVEFLRDNGIRDGAVDINVSGQLTVEDLYRYF